MDWEKVATYLHNESLSLKDRSAAFIGDEKTMSEMWLRARIADLLAEALRAGLSATPQ